MLYWTKVLPDPGIFICPSSPDTNRNGVDLGLHGNPTDADLAPGAVSYAGMAATSVRVYETVKLGRTDVTSKSAIRDDFPPNEPMASDDTQRPINHGEEQNGGMAVLFFDSHVEFWTHTKVSLLYGVGQGDLVALRN